jgi:hypothetical protein
MVIDVSEGTAPAGTPIVTPLCVTLPPEVPMI